MGEEHLLKMALDFSEKAISQTRTVERDPKTGNLRIINKPYEFTKEFKESVINDMKEYSHNFMENIRHGMQLRGVLCLCESFKEILMWSYYGGDHKGFCIEYDISEEWQKKDIAFKKVKYSDEIPKLDVNEYSNFDELYIAKADCWKHEKEWRSICSSSGLQHAPEVIGIYFGAKMAEDDKKYIKDFLSKHKNIKYYSMKMKSGIYNLKYMKY